MKSGVIFIIIDFVVRRGKMWRYNCITGIIVFKLLQVIVKKKVKSTLLDCSIYSAVFVTTFSFYPH